MNGTHGSNKLWLFVALPMLISATSCSLFHGPTTTAPPNEAKLAICQDGNETQVRSWNRIVRMAELPGDPHGIGPGVIWAGNHLHRCRMGD